MAESCTLVPAPRALRYSTALLLALLLLALSVDLAASTHGVTGTPPRFIQNQEPEDMVVFATNADNSKASLTLYCNATGDPAPTITWYRSGSTFNNPRTTVNANGTLLIVNITEGMDATPGGLLYHCTAMNKFGTIRSRTANISYAYFNGFDGPSGTMNVNVTTGSQAAVAIECRVRGANPPPIIRWRDANGLLAEAGNRLRFLHNGRYLLITQLTNTQLSTTYSCEVTNALLHQTRTSPTTYALVNNVGANDFMIYKRFVERTVLVEDNAGAFELSYIAGAGRNFTPFGILSCQRSGDTLRSDISPLSLPDVGGVISAPIPDTNSGEQLPASAASVTFEVSCTFITGQQTSQIQTTLTIQVPPEIVPPFPQNKLEEFAGDPVTFTCNVAGIPTPTVTWYFNGAPRNAGNGVSISGNTLTISPTTVGHTGMYQCFASNPVGSVQYSWALEVRAPEIMAVSSSSSEIHAMDTGIRLPLLVAPSDGGNAVLFAVVTADPCPTIQWTVNGSNIGSAGYTLNNPCSTSPAGTTSFNFTLTIAATSPRTGTYAARIMNRAGSQDVMPVFVTPPVPVIITALQVLGGPNCLLSGSEVDIQCVNFGLPRPEIIFFRGTEQITPGQGDFSNFQTVDGRFDTIKLTMAQQTDGGDYVCEARRGSVELNRSRPVELVFCTRPTIADLPAPDTNTEGMRFELVCTFTGVPAPMIRWEKDESVFSLGVGRRIINSTGRSALEIESLRVSDAGVYRCSVSNVGGMDSRSVRLEVRPTPSPPLLDTPAIIGIAAGGAGAVLLLTVVCLLMVCVYCCARRGHEGGATFETVKDGGQNFTDARGNVDQDSDEEFGQVEAYDPDYGSLPAMRPAQPPQYRPTPNYPHGVHMSDDMEMTKVPPPDTDSTHFNEFITTPYGKQAPPFPRAGQW